MVLLMAIKNNWVTNRFLPFILVICIIIVIYAFFFTGKDVSPESSSLSSNFISSQFLEYRDVDNGFSVKYPKSYFVERVSNGNQVLRMAVPGAFGSLYVTISMFNSSERVFSEDVRNLIFSDVEANLTEEMAYEKTISGQASETLIVKTKLFDPTSNYTVTFLKALYKCNGHDFLLLAGIPQDFALEEDVVNFMIQSFQCD